MYFGQLLQKKEMRFTL